MKILKSLFILALVAVVFSSCNKDEDTKPAPVITFINNISQATVNPGDNYTIAGTITSEEGLAEVKYFNVTQAGETQIGQAITSFTDVNNYSFQKTINDINQQTVIKVMATDKKNQTSVKNFTINVNQQGNLKSYNNIILGAQTNATIGSSFASFNGLVYNLTDAKNNSSKIDLIFFYGTTNLATLSAPSNLTELNQVFTTGSAPNTWTTNNDTKLLKNNSLNFDNIINSADIPDVQATGGNKVNNLAVGDIIVFKTAATNVDYPSKKGLLKVKAITGTGATATITYDVKAEN